MIFMQNYLSLDISLLVIRICLSLWYRKDIFNMGFLSPALRKKRRDQSFLLAPAMVQVPRGKIILRSKRHILELHIRPSSSNMIKQTKKMRWKFQYFSSRSFFSYWNKMEQSLKFFASWYFSSYNKNSNP